MFNSKQVKLEIDMNGVRYKVFTKKKKAPQPLSLPSKKGVLYLHIERASIEKKALDRHHHLPNPTGYGWADIDRSLALQRGYLKRGPRFHS